jgi:hypothetical protein
MKTWMSNLAPLRTDLLKHADPLYEKFEEEFQEVVVKVEQTPIIETRQKTYTVQEPHEVWAGDLGKIFGQKKTKYRDATKSITEQVQIGTRTVTHMEAQKRVKKTKYSGEVVFTEWEPLRTWTV